MQQSQGAWALHALLYPTTPPSCRQPPPLPHYFQVGETYNIGTQKERSVVDVARDICKLFKRDPDSTIKHVKDRAFNDRRYFM